MSAALSLPSLVADSEFVRLTWQEVFWPSTLTSEPATRLLTNWASAPHGPYIALEARSTVDGVRYLVGTHPDKADAVRRDIEDYIGGVIVTNTDKRPATMTARRLRGNGAGSLLDSSVTATRAILSALSRVEAGEVLTVQLLLGVHFPPRLAPHDMPRIDQPITSRLLRGVDREHRSAVTRAVGDKRTQPTIDTVVRIGVRARTPERRRVLIKATAAAYATLVTPTARLSLVGEKATALDQPKVQWRSLRADRRTPDEIALLSAWPLGQGTNDLALPGLPAAHPRPLRPTIPPPEDGLPIGEAAAPGVVGQPLALGIKDSRQHLRVIGPTGVGKSSLLRGMIAADRAAGRPTIVIEPKDLVTEVLSDTLPEQLDSTIVIDATDAVPVGLNPLTGDGRDPDVTANHLFGVITARYDDIGPRSADILRHTLQAVAGRDDASLVLVPILLTNPGFRRSVTQRIIRDDPVSAGPFWRWFDSLSPEMATQVTAPLLNKLRPLLSPMLRGVLGQSRPRITMRRVIDEGLTLLVPLQAGVMGADNARLLGTVVLAEVWQAIREQAAKPPEVRPTIGLYLDEFQDFIAGFGSDLEAALTQSRSLGGSIRLAHQHSAQLPISIRHTVEANARSTVVFQTELTDARMFAGRDPRLVPDDFASLPPFHFYASLVSGGAVRPYVSGRTVLPPEPIADPTEVRRASRERFGRPCQEIDAEVLGLLGQDDDLGDDIGGPRRRNAR